MPSFLTPDRHPYSVRFSPHHPNLLAVAASQFYGFAGGGSLYLLEIDDIYNVALIQRRHWEWTDGLFDVVSGGVKQGDLIRADLMYFSLTGLVTTLQ